ncbi:hypothetical protein LINPERHAP2_LOCUS22961, partial [Linum perenne]
LRGIGLSDEAVVFSLATLAVIELRGAIPVGYLLQLKPMTLTVFSVLGSVLVSLTPSDVEDDINGGFEEPEVDWRPTQSGRKRGRPSKGDVSSMGASNVQVTSSSGLHPWSSKDRRSKKSCQDPRYNERELKIALVVIKKIMEMDEAASFSSPIEPVPLGFNRSNVEDTPMDFGTICNNIQAGFKYLNSFDVYADAKRIWEHCLRYNKKGDYIVYLMKRVKK